MYIYGNMANLRKCSRCKSEIDISYFGMNRKKEPYKTCDTCRSKRKPSNNTDKGISRFDISDEHYADVDKELRAKYEKEFQKDSRDHTMNIFSEEEQIDRYAQMLMFWDTNRPVCHNLDDIISDPRQAAKYFYISDMRSQLNEAIMTKFDSRVQKLIGDKYKELVETHNEKLAVEKFTKRNKYPTFQDMLIMLSKPEDVHVYAEYGELNHEWMKKIWDDIHNEEKIKVVGKLINKRGGFQAMTQNHAALIKVVQHFLKQDKLNDIDAMTIQYNIYKGVERAWHGIGEWLC